MPVLFNRTAESLGPSLYASAASRYILRAIRMSPRISGVMMGFGFWAVAAVACAALGSSRKPLDGGVDWGAAAGATWATAKLRAIEQRMETIVGLLRETSAASDNTLDAQFRERVLYPLAYQLRTRVKTARKN